MYKIEVKTNKQSKQQQQKQKERCKMWKDVKATCLLNC